MKPIIDNLEGLIPMDSNTCFCVTCEIGGATYEQNVKNHTNWYRCGLYCGGHLRFTFPCESKTAAVGAASGNEAVQRAFGRTDFGNRGAYAAGFSRLGGIQR